MQDFDEFLGRDLRLFGVDDAFIQKLRWMDTFVRDEVEPLDLLGFSPYDVKHPARAALFPPLQRKVRDMGLWACHLGPELGGPGYGQFKLALMNIILGRCWCAPKVFGTAAPDTGNTEILAHFGTPGQKERYLKPLMEDQISSCYSMSEPHGGSDPTQFRLRAVEEADHWVLNGEKLWSTNAKYAAFLLVLAVTDPQAPAHSRLSMFIVPAETPGVQVVRSIGVGIDELDIHDPERGKPGGEHAYVRYTDVRIPKDHLLGHRGGGFVVAQTRLSGGRIHYGMRTVGICKRALDMMCERVKSRTTKGEPLAAKQMTQEKIADCWSELEQFKLLVLRTAWLIDQSPKDYKPVRKDIAAVKAATPKVIDYIVTRAMRLHGGYGLSWEMPFAQYLTLGHIMSVADGPTEIHKVTLAKEVLRPYAGESSQEGIFFTRHSRFARQREAVAKFTPVLKAAGVDVSWIQRGPGLNSKM